MGRSALDGCSCMLRKRLCAGDVTGIMSTALQPFDTPIYIACGLALYGWPGHFVPLFGHAQPPNCQLLLSPMHLSWFGSQLQLHASVIVALLHLFPQLLSKSTDPHTKAPSLQVQ